MLKWNRTLGIASLLLAITAGSASAQLHYTGSHTLGESIIPTAAKAFTAKTGIVFGKVDVRGSGEGLEALARGEAQIAGVSRALSFAEKRQGLAYEIIGYVAVVVFVRPDNPVLSLTCPQLRGIYTGRITNWRDVGGPNAPVALITQILGSGRALMVEFQQNVMDGAPYRTDRIEVDLQPAMVTRGATERHGIAARSLAFAWPGIKVLAIDGFEPDLLSISSGSRPLILAVQGHPSLVAKQFLDFMVGPEGQAIVARKFVSVR